MNAIGIAQRLMEKVLIDAMNCMQDAKVKDV